jgi:hypothetical protein
MMQMFNDSAMAQKIDHILLIERISVLAFRKSLIEAHS